MADGVFISHSSLDSPEASSFRLNLRTLLKSRGYTVLLDEACLQAGDRWQAKLYRWLAECAGAVLLLTPQALESDWVRKEATILTWRAALNSNVRVVPVLIGVTKDEVENAFPAIDVFVPQVVDSAKFGDLDAALAAVGSAFSDIGLRDDRLRRWGAELAALLKEVNEFYLDSIAEELELSPQDWFINNDGVATLAHGLLQRNNLSDVEPLVRSFVRGMNGRHRFVDLLAPIGVPVETATGLLRALNRPPGRRVIALAGTDFLTAARHVQRATCVSVYYETINMPDAATEDAPEALYDAIGVTLVGALKRRNADAVAGALERQDARGRHVLVLRTRTDDEDDGLPMSVVERLVQRLRIDYPHLVVLILTHYPYPSTSEIGYPDPYFVMPCIDQTSEEDDAAAWAKLLDDIHA